MHEVQISTSAHFRSEGSHYKATVHLKRAFRRASLQGRTIDSFDWFCKKYSLRSKSPLAEQLASTLVVKSNSIKNMCIKWRLRITPKHMANTSTNIQQDLGTEPLCEWRHTLQCLFRCLLNQMDALFDVNRNAHLKSGWLIRLWYIR